jgi:hypothetical protein
MIYPNLTGTIISIHNDIQMCIIKTNQNITDNPINANRRINDLVLGSTETFNKSIEIAQKYYNEAAQNYLKLCK